MPVVSVDVDPGPPSPLPPLRVAVVGAGPAGIYAAEALSRQDAVPVAVDLIDRLPTPFGLVRHGIAPDHPKMRAIRDTLHRALDHPLVRFVGNVEVGRDISSTDLLRAVDAVVYTYGAALDRQLAIPGEELPGSLAATELVSWYTGHPDADRAKVEAALARARSVVVVGVGNVALDVARVLARTPAELEPTDMPQHVLDTLAAAPVQEVTILGRRGPVHATFTTQELRELDELAQATVLVDPADLEPATAAEEQAAEERHVARNLAVLREWAQHTLEPGRTPLRLRFHARPVRLLGEDRVTAVEVERTVVDEEGRASGTGEVDLLPADLVVRSVGYRGTGLPELPLDERRGTVPNEAGRVLRDGRTSPGEYVAGWIKRGPSGVVGTNKHDARETVAALLDDVAAGVVCPGGGGVDDLVSELRTRGTDPVLLDDWRAIDAAEVALGATRGRARTTLHEWESLLAAVREAAARAR
ncbi:FAD-dependent oxidoreductase [Geodermatophilus sp. CPCC 206100]|uniref:FAD-dependent oxidoreductase n=1 Tax=Geodermatophilus sp. CPCC 206100 TaxID=3020054 RepID=UPI003B00CF1A